MVQVQGVGKRYRLGTLNRQQFTDDVKAWTAKLLGRPDPTVPLDMAIDPQRIGEDFWALRDVSFEVRKGEVAASKAHIGFAARWLGANAVQLHGGIGMTEEYVVGHCFKSLTVADALFGNADAHLARIAGTLHVSN